MRILVVGADGQLGRSIQDIVKKHGHLGFIFTDYNELDITDPIKVKDFFRENTFGYCINCAAYTAVDKAESESEKAFLINADAVRILAEACNEHNVVLIHVSTDFVFDGTKTTPYTEQDFPNPINVYGASKLKGEQYIQDILRQYFIIRTSWVYSQYGHNFVKTMLRLGKERKQLNVVSDQYGSPTYATDLAEFIMNIIKEKSDDFGIFQFSNTGYISWFDFAKTVIEISNYETTILPISSKDYEGKALRPQYSVMNTDKAQIFIGKPIPRWDKSLKKCLEEMSL